MKRLYCLEPAIKGRWAKATHLISRLPHYSNMWLGTLIFRILKLFWVLTQRKRNMIWMLNCRSRHAEHYSSTCGLPRYHDASAGFEIEVVLAYQSKIWDRKVILDMWAWSHPYAYISLPLWYKTPPPCHACIALPPRKIPSLQVFLYCPPREQMFILVETRLRFFLPDRMCSMQCLMQCKTYFVVSWHFHWRFRVARKLLQRWCTQSEEWCSKTK